MLQTTRAAAGAVLILALITGAAGCGGDADPDDSTAPGSPTATATASSAATSSPTSAPTPTSAVPRINCATAFPQAGAEALAGEKLGPPKPEAVSSLAGCRWDSAKSGTWVLALAVPASQWAKAVPATIDAALESGEEFTGRDQLVEARRLIVEGGKLDNTAACRIFSTIVSVAQGVPAGTTKVFSYVPDKASAQAINEQACLKGRYYSIQPASATLKPGPALEKRITRALATFSG